MYQFRSIMKGHRWDSQLVWKFWSLRAPSTEVANKSTFTVSSVLAPFWPRIPYRKSSWWIGQTEWMKFFLDSLLRVGNSLQNRNIPGCILCRQQLILETMVNLAKIFLEEIARQTQNDVKLLNRTHWYFQRRRSLEGKARLRPAIPVPNSQQTRRNYRQGSGQTPLKRE